MKPATKIAVMLFALVALAHGLRLVMGTEAIIDGWMVPMWVSVIGVLLPGGLAFLIVREHQ